MGKQIKKGSKVRRMGASFIAVEKGKVYTVKEVEMGLKKVIKLEGVAGLYVMGLFDLVEQNSIKKLG